MNKLKLSKTEKVLNHLKDTGSITSWEAIQLFGATRLSSIIYNLKDKGYKIKAEKEEFIDRYGDVGHYARYYLITI